MTPEAKAREKIDQKLTQAGWLVQDFKTINLSAAPGIAVREHPTDTGPADYVLYVNRSAVGVIEAKRDEAGENLTAHERQTERYAGATLKWRQDKTPLPFLFEATSQIIHFTDGRDPAPRAREIFHFFQTRDAGPMAGPARHAALPPQRADAAAASAKAARLPGQRRHRAGKVPRPK